MRLLLDTHVFLWAITGDARLKPASRSLERQHPVGNLLLSPDIHGRNNAAPAEKAAFFFNIRRTFSAISQTGLNLP